MDIRQFSPQTQRTLAKRDFNQDAKLTVRELEVLAKVPQAPGIDQKDLAVIQDALKKAKGPDTIVVSLVEEALPPGMHAPEPLYRLPAEKAKKPSATEAKPAKSTQAKAAASPDGFKMSANQPKAANKAPTGSEAYEVQTTTKAGPLQLKSTSSFTDGQHTKSQLKASLDVASDLGLSVGVEAGEASTAKSGSTKSGSTKATSGKTTTSKGRSTPVTSATGQTVTLSSQVKAGRVKLSAQGKLDQATSNLTDLGGSAELTVIDGHSVKASVSQTKDKLSFSKIGTAHDLGQGLNLTTSTQLDDTGKVKKYGGGFSYSAQKDSLFEGLSLSGEALAKTDSSYTRPLQGWEKPELKFEFRFSRAFSS